MFNLHTAVQTQLITDILQPVGRWKQEPNGTYAVDAHGAQVFIDYAAPRDVPELMQTWLRLLNDHLRIATDVDSALTAYVELHISFVRIHPFFDGNGRMARLLANLPVLRSGSPPIIIPKEKRREYIGLLAAYELATGTVTTNRPLLLQPKSPLMSKSSIGQRIDPLNSEGMLPRAICRSMSASICLASFF